MHFHSLFGATPVMRTTGRSSHRRCSVRKGVLKKETLAQVLSCEFYEISKNTLFTEHFWATASVAEYDVFQYNTPPSSTVRCYCNSKMMQRSNFLGRKTSF